MHEMLRDLIVFNDCLILIAMDRGHCQAVLKQKVLIPTHKASAYRPQVPDKPALAMGTMSQYSAHILISITHVLTSTSNRDLPLGEDE